MSREQLFVDAIDTLYRLGWATLAWLLLLAVAATAALYTITVTVWGICRALWKVARWRPAGPSWRRGRLRARIHARTRTRTPQERTEPHGYQEAA
ncbi:hypothetical protein [Streptomyces sp. NPDC091215]|uniref:hypothetical protein n=1 Tax=Streptomyces sp. NPDC091215 TaxID=3155192 RepID=UPI003424C24E